jgi:hypothetical protein
MIDRRSLITGLISLVAAPAIVRAGSLMPVKVMKDDSAFEFSGFYQLFPLRSDVPPVIFQDRLFWVMQDKITIAWSKIPPDWKDWVPSKVWEPDEIVGFPK